MNWEKISEASDFISYEKKNDNLNIRIEARLNKDKTWDIYKTYFDGKKNNFIDEYKAKDNKEVRELLGRLMSEKDLSLQEIENIKNQKSKGLDIKLKRLFKEYNLEKWGIYFNSVDVGFLNIRYDDRIEVDLVIDEGFRFLEKELLEELKSVLGLAKIEGDILFNNYYYRNHTHRMLRNKSSGKLVIGKIEFGFRNSI